VYVLKNVNHVEYRFYSDKAWNDDEFKEAHAKAVAVLMNLEAKRQRIGPWEKVTRQQVTLAWVCVYFFSILLCQCWFLRVYKIRPVHLVGWTPIAVGRCSCIIIIHTLFHGIP
jgi:hypothetical protein